MALSLFLILFLFHYSHLLAHHSASAQNHTRCPLFTCGRLGEIGFPFRNTSPSSSSYPDCGSFILNCADLIPKVQFSTQQRWYSISNMSYSGKKISITDPELEYQLDTNQCDSLTNFTLPVSPSVQFYVATILHPFFKCKRGKSPQQFLQSLSNFTGCGGRYDLYFTKDYNTSLPPLPEPLINMCSAYQLPVSWLQNSSNYRLAGLNGTAYTVQAAFVHGQLEQQFITYHAFAPDQPKNGLIPYVTTPPAPAPVTGSVPVVVPKAPAPASETPASETGSVPVVVPKAPAPASETGSRQPNLTRVSSPVRNLTSLWNAEYSLRWEILPDCSECQVKGGFCIEDANGNFGCSHLKGTNADNRDCLNSLIYPMFGSYLIAITFRSTSDLA